MRSTPAYARRDLCLICLGTKGVACPSTQMDQEARAYRVVLAIRNTQLETQCARETRFLRTPLASIWGSFLRFIETGFTNSLAACHRPLASANAKGLPTTQSPRVNLCSSFVGWHLVIHSYGACFCCCLLPACFCCTCTSRFLHCFVFAHNHIHHSVCTL